MMSPLLPLLALVARGDAYGYELKRLVETEFAPQWKIDFAQLYRSLAKLHAQGLTRVRAVSSADGPERKQYAITARGRAALDEWMQEPATADEAFWVKLRLATSLGYDTRRLVAAERERRAQTDVVLKQTPQTEFVTRGDEMPLRIAGSDDALLAQLAVETDALAHVTGSTGGLVALASGQADVVGAHLREPEAEEYNLSFIQHLVAEQDILVVNLAVREYGLLVARGNQKQIRAVRDLVRRDVSVVNRSRGSGARLWLGRHVRAARLDPLTLRGWSSAAATYEAVANALNAGAADTGPGLRATAEKYDLDFIALGEERFDLALARELFESRRGKKLREVLHGRRFREYARTLAGYDLSSSGRVIAEIKYGAKPGARKRR